MDDSDFVERMLTAAAHYRVAMAGPAVPNDGTRAILRRMAWDALKKVGILWAGPRIQAVLDLGMYTSRYDRQAEQLAIINGVHAPEDIQR